MSTAIDHVQLPKVQLFAGSTATASVAAASDYTGPTAVVEKLRESGGVAFWGLTTNDHPQRVIKDVDRLGIISSTIERKVNMLLSGRLTYGTVEHDERTGLAIMKPIRSVEIDDFLEDSNIELYCGEALSDYYHFANFFPEFRMGRAYDRVVGLGCHDASHVRLSTMDDKGDINTCYLGDWKDISNKSEAKPLPALNPYFRVPQQMLGLRKPAYVLPQRDLGKGRFYYGIAPWNSLRASGWVDVAIRVPELKKHLLKNLMHLRYHIEYSPAYFSTKYKDWEKKSEDEQVNIIKTEVADFDKWAKGESGQGGVLMTSQYESGLTKELRSLITIHEMPMGIKDGAYITDAREVEYIIARDLGLDPAIAGIGPGKNSSSPGSGSNARVLRTNHILDQKRVADKILKPLNYISRINGWNEKYGKGQRLEFWFENYYAATLDRTMQVDSSNGPVVDPNNADA